MMEPVEPMMRPGLSLREWRSKLEAIYLEDWNAQPLAEARREAPGSVYWRITELIDERPDDEDLDTSDTGCCVPLGAPLGARRRQVLAALSLGSRILWDPDREPLATFDPDEAPW